MPLFKPGLSCFVALALLGGALLAQGPGQTQTQVQPPAGQAPASPPAAKPDPTLALKIGNPKLKDKSMEVGLGAIMSGETGAAVGFERMVQGMRASRLVYVGETHNSLPMHEIQYQVLRALYAQDRHLAVGMEMFPVTVQETLNRWSAGLLTKEEFIREARWYVNWNFNYGFYEKILDFAKEHRLPVYALNVPRETITKLRMKGWEALDAEEKKLVPKAPDVTNPDHRALIRTIFEAADIPHQMKGAGLEMVFEGLYRAQVAWDEIMAANAVKGAGGEGRRMLVCAGSGHVLYNLGINMRAAGLGGKPWTTVVAVSIPSGARSLQVSRTFADYVFGLAEEAKPAFPTIGLSFKKIDGLANLFLESKPTDGAASRADFEKGDVVLSVDGRAFDDINEVRTYLARFKCGDEAKFRLLRNGAVKEVSLKFDTCPAEPPSPGEKK